MNAPAPDPSAPLWLVVVSVLTALVTCAQVVLAIVAPRTKTTADDRALTIVQRVLGWLKKLNPLAVVAIMVLGIGLVSVIACSSTARPIENAIKDAPVIDCTVLDGSKVDITKDAIAHVIVSKPGDWMSAAEAAAAYGAAVGGCTLAKLVQTFLTRRGATDEQWSAHEALEHFRASVAGGATFRTEVGDL